jgi:hypothetical protein
MRGILGEPDSVQMEPDGLVLGVRMMGDQEMYELAKVQARWKFGGYGVLVFQAVWCHQA